MQYNQLRIHLIIIFLIFLSFLFLSNFASAKNVPSDSNFLKINEFKCTWDIRVNFDHNTEEVENINKRKGLLEFSVFNLNSDNGIATMSPPYYQNVVYYKTELFNKFFTYSANKNKKFENGRSFDLVIFNKLDENNNYKAVSSSSLFSNDLDSLAKQYGEGTMVWSTTHYGYCEAIKKWENYFL